MKNKLLVLGVTTILFGCGGGGGGDGEPAAVPEVANETEINQIDKVSIESFLPGNVTEENAGTIGVNVSRALVKMSQEFYDLFPKSTVIYGEDLNLVAAFEEEEACSESGAWTLVVNADNLTNSDVGRLFGQGETYSNDYSWCKDQSILSGRYYLNGKESFTGEAGAFDALGSAYLEYNKGTYTYQNVSLSDRDGSDLVRFRNGSVTVESNESVLRVTSNKFSLIEDDVTNRVWFTVSNLDMTSQKDLNGVFEGVTLDAAPFDIEIEDVDAKYTVYVDDPLNMLAVNGWAPNEGTIVIEGNNGRLKVEFMSGVFVGYIDLEKDGDYETSFSINSDLY